MSRVENQLEIKIQQLQEQLAEQSARLLRETSDRLAAEQALHSYSAKLRQQNQLLTKLARDKVLNQTKLKPALKEIAEAAAHNIEVERASIWQYGDSGSKIECLDLFEKTFNKHSEGFELTAVEYPAYFQALQQEEPIAASNARTDSRTREFTDSYLIPIGITAMLDVPIRLGKKTVGVLCLEHIGGVRDWMPSEENFARSLADLVSLVLEAQQHKQTQVALKESESKYRVLVEASQDMIWSIDVEGRYTFVNPAVERIYGYLPSEMLGRRFTDFMSPAQAAKDMEVFGRILDGESIFQYETSHQAKDGSEIYLMFNAIALRDSQGNIIGASGTATNITSRKQVEEALAQSQRFLNSIIEHIPSALFVKDVANDFRFVLWNKTCEEIFGGSREEIIGSNDYDLFPQEQADFFRAKDLAVISQNKSMEIPCEPVDSYSRGPILLRTVKVPISNDGKVTHLLCISEDITERKRREEALRLIVEGTASTTGDRFMHSCVRYLAEVLQVRYAIITEWADEPRTKVRALAFWDGETWTENIEYDIPETPCSKVLNGTTYYCDRNLQALFPNNGGLVPIANSYLGMPLIDSDSNIIGHLAVLDTKPMQQDLGRESILKIFAARAAAELERQQVEKALRQSEERLQYLLTSSPAAIYSCKPLENYAVSFISDNVTAIVGYSAREFLENYNFWASHVHPSDRDRVFAGLEKLFTQGYHSDEYRFLNKDGSYRWVYDRIRLIRDADGNPVECIGYWVDISDRKQAEAALRESEERFELAVAGTNDGIWDGDLITNRIYYSPVWMKILGLSEGELPPLYSTWWDRVHPDDAANVRKFFQDHLDGKIPLYQQTYRMKHSEGRWVWIESKGKCLRDESGKAYRIVGTIADITERKQAESALRESAERERAIATVIQRMRQTLDIETIFAATTEELRQLINCDRVGVYRFNPDWSGKFVAESAGSEWIPLVQQQHRDPTLMKDAVEDRDCVVKSLDSSEPSVQDTYLQETQGGRYSRGASYMVVPDIYQAGFTDCYIDLLERFQARGYMIVPIFCGSKLWGLLASYQNSAPRQWKAAEINMMVQIGNQLGVALQQAELLAQLQKALLAADAANRAKSEFLANMSHELRTPLNAILGFTQLMNRDSSLSGEHQQHLKIINRAGEHLLELINDILEVSKIEAGRTTLNETTFDLIRLLDGLEKMLQFKAESKKIKLLMECSPDIPHYVRNDESKLRQVLLNLLGNAIKFTESGTVTLRVRNGIPNALFPITTSLHFEVEDTGPGIAPEEINLLFEPFMQTASGRKSQQGTGLGLPISRKYVQLMGGDITVTSTFGKGSLFAFDIKISLAETAEIEPIQNQPKVMGLAPNQPEYRLLVVDDVSESRLLLVKLLTSIGFKVLEAENGREAVALASSWQPHLILMDMQMPVMDGYEATKQIKARERESKESLQAKIQNQTVIIAFTASAFEEQRQAILAVGCDDFIRKPFQEEVLLQKIRQHLGVGYVYEEESQHPENPRQKTPVTYTDLQSLSEQMPESWVTRLHHAAASGNDDLILQLLEQITPENSSLALALTDLTNNFQFEKIIELTQQAAK